MKKIYMILSCVLIMLFIAGCKSNNVNVIKENAKNKPISEPAKSFDSDNTDDSNIIKSRYGEAFCVDITNKGTVIENTHDINSNILTIADKDYALPIHFSDLLENGWFMPDEYTFEDTFEPNKTTNLIGFFLENNTGVELYIGKAINNTDEIIKLEDCIIGSLSFNNMEYDNLLTGNKETVDFVLPGGINANSTAANVIEIFGTPDKAENFGSMMTGETTLSYYNNTVSNISYYFNFEEDGRLKSFSMSGEKQ